MKKVSVIIPVYYNEKSLTILFTRFLKVENILNSMGVSLELIFVDDGSGDKSLEELLKIKFSHEQTKIVKLTRNFGAVHASKAGLRFVTGGCFTILAADLQDPPELIVDMVKKWLAGAKYVVCVRQSREDPFLSKLLSSIYYRLVRLCIIKDYPLGGFDITLVDKELFPFFENSGKNLYTPFLGYWLGYKPEVIYYHRPKRMHGRSGWSFSKKINASLDIFLGYSVFPIRFFSFIGMLVSILSFLYGFHIIINASLKGTDVPGFATIVVLISFLLGIVISTLSIIGEYLWRISEEINKRPEVVIEKVY